MQSFQEWMLSLLFLPLMFIVGNFMLHIPYPEVPHSYLGQLDDPAYDAAGVTIAFTPITPTTRQIMNAVALKSVMTGIKLEAMDSERALEEAWISNNEIIGVVFKNNFTYYLRFPTGNVAIPNDNLGYIDTCYNFSVRYCDSPKYWYKGFLSLQSSIDAAIIEGKEKAQSTHEDDGAARHCILALLEPALCRLRADPVLPADGSRGAGGFLRQQLPRRPAAVFPLWPRMYPHGFHALLPLTDIQARWLHGVPHHLSLRLPEPRSADRKSSRAFEVVSGSLLSFCI